jgi:gamma-glutamylcyclotransferase (GGCT)/AIG2-like uncharacterized protein YtfP
MSERVRVFVYGTLLSGEPNHRLLDDRDLVGPARTEARFTLFNFGAFPAMVEGGETAVTGEVYEVDAQTLARLDRLEGHPKFYCRQPIKLEGGGDAIAYLVPEHRAQGRATIQTGDWRSASKERT